MRRQSESRLSGKQAENPDPQFGHDTQRLFHELQVHQIELELQNEELNQANLAAKAALERFTDLYDFAPVGYFSLDDLGVMVELNMAGAVLLGVERSRLTGRRFQLFVSPRTRPVFQEFLDRIFSGSGRQYCEVELQRETGHSFWAELAGTSVPTGDAQQRLSRIVVSDISARRMAEVEHKRVGILAAKNRELENEISLRRASEASLKESEERFRGLLHQSRLLEKRLRNMTHEMLKMQEAERKKISRELHDEVSQILLGINVQLEIDAEQNLADFVVQLAADLLSFCLLHLQHLVRHVSQPFLQQTRLMQEAAKTFLAFLERGLARPAQGNLILQFPVLGGQNPDAFVLYLRHPAGRNVGYHYPGQSLLSVAGRH